MLDFFSPVVGQEPGLLPRGLQCPTPRLSRTGEAAGWVRCWPGGRGTAGAGSHLPSLGGATGKCGSPRARGFRGGAGQAGLRVLGVPGEPELRSIVVCGRVVLESRGEAAEGTGGMGAAGRRRQQGRAAAPESPRDGHSGEAASETLGAACPAKTFFF